jgi:hypothetical protein
VEESASARLGYYRADVRNGEGKIVGLFSGTVYRTNREFSPEAEARVGQSSEEGNG